MFIGVRPSVFPTLHLSPVFLTLNVPSSPNGSSFCSDSRALCSFLCLSVCHSLSYSLLFLLLPSLSHAYSLFSTCLSVCAPLSLSPIFSFSDPYLILRLSSLPSFPPSLHLDPPCIHPIDGVNLLFLFSSAYLRSSDIFISTWGQASGLPRHILRSIPHTEKEMPGRLCLHGVPATRFIIIIRL